MNEKIDIFDFILCEGMTVGFSKNQKSDTVCIYDFKLSWTEENAKNNDSFEFMWYTPMVGIRYMWTPMCGSTHSIEPNWCASKFTMISSNAPACVFYNGKSYSRYSWALSECAKHVELKAGVVEQTGDLMSYVKMPVKQFTNQYSTTMSVRIDQTELPVAKAVDAISKWWANDLGMTPAYVPGNAKEPVYSFWYSYHQDITAKSVEEECKRAADLGFKVCIIDDGWQTDDVNGAYAYCGDWEVAGSKIPDMAAHVKTVQDMGLKYVLWYSVPFLGYKSKHYEEMKKYTLRNVDRLKTSVLDPRYKKVRDFLINTYKNALLDWNLDGFKLDFIDQWHEDKDNAPYNPEMDIPALQDAVDCLMSGITKVLKEIKPDVLIEFRQNYIGPNMRKAGNMFRVADCPNDYIKNRLGMFDLRMMMGETAVHSDMLMWHKNEAPEIAAVQIISTLFSVMQYSAKLDEIDEATKKMSKFWLGFMQKHRDLLLSGDLSVYEPHMNYTWAKTTLGSECVAAVYAVDKCIQPDMCDCIYIANGCEGERVLAEICGKYNVSVLNCMGNKVSEDVMECNGVTSISIPVGGIAVLEKV